MIMSGYGVLRDVRVCESCNKEIDYEPGGPDDLNRSGYDKDIEKRARKREKLQAKHDESRAKKQELRAGNGN